MKTTILTLVVLAGLLTSCGDGDETTPGTPVLEDAVYTTFHPTTWMAERIASGKVAVRCPLPKGEDAIFWNPPRDILGRYQAARLVVVNGAEFEKWVANASLARSRTVDTAASFKDRFISYEGITHSHGGGQGEHTHEGIDGHTWLDPELAKVQARVIAQAMKKTWPEHAAAFDKGLADLKSDLDGIRAELEKLTPKLKDVTLLASHPAYNYLVRGMGWTIKNLDIDPEAELSGKAIVEIDLKLEDAKAKRIMLWESAPSAATVKMLQDRFNLVTVAFSPAENLDEGAGAYLEVMRANAQRLADALAR